MAFLGTSGTELLSLRESSGRIRWRVASVWADLHPRPMPEPRSEAEEDTDSGIERSWQSSPPSMPHDWDRVHSLHSPLPNYNPNAVRDAFEVWVMSNGPYPRDRVNLTYLEALSLSEYEAPNQMIDVYYERTPSSAESPTPEPSHLVDQEVRDQGLFRREIVERINEQLE